MFRSMQVATLLCVAIAMALSLAHALELPGKMRLDREAYLTVQPIYYPGFTFGGFIGEACGMLLLIALAAAAYGTSAFGWVSGALILFLAGHVIYWVFTHPANGFWLKDADLSGLGVGFFSLFAPDPGSDWTKLRNIWEYSHVARAGCFMLSLILLAAGVTA